MHVKAILDQKGRDVTTISAAQNLQEAVKLLGEKRIGALLVVSHEEGLDGILSERDIIKALALQGEAALQFPVEKIMTHNVITAREDEEVLSLLDKMTKGRFRHIPIMQGNEIRGMVSIGDIVKARLEEMAQEHAHLKNYIAG
jgi:CBS domain-containing protein